MVYLIMEMKIKQVIQNDLHTVITTYKIMQKISSNMLIWDDKNLSQMYYDEHSRKANEQSSQYNVQSH